MHMTPGYLWHAVFAVLSLHWPPLASLKAQPVLFVYFEVAGTQV